MFLTSADFIGKYKIAKDCFNKAELELYIEKYEKMYLQDLLGCELYDIFVSDLNDDDSPKPQELRFRKVFEEFCFDANCGVRNRSDGFLEMLKGFVYYHYVIDQKFKNTLVGTVVNESSFSREVALAKSNIEDRYNLAVDSYVSIQAYVIDDKNTYPEFNGIVKRMSFFGGAF